MTSPAPISPPPREVALPEQREADFVAEESAEEDDGETILPLPRTGLQAWDTLMLRYDLSHPQHLDVLRKAGQDRQFRESLMRDIQKLGILPNPTRGLNPMAIIGTIVRSVNDARETLSRS